MEQKQFKCTGDCLQCSIVQRQYCACQHAYNTLRMVQAMQDALNVMEDTMEGLTAKLAAIQDNEAHVFNPATVPDVSPSGQDTAQKGDGAEE